MNYDLLGLLRAWVRRLPGFYSDRDRDPREWLRLLLAWCLLSMARLFLSAGARVGQTEQQVELVRPERPHLRVDGIRLDPVASAEVQRGRDYLAAEMGVRRSPRLRDM